MQTIRPDRCRIIGFSTAWVSAKAASGSSPAPRPSRRASSAAAAGRARCRRCSPGCRSARAARASPATARSMSRRLGHVERDRLGRAARRDDLVGDRAARSRRVPRRRRAHPARRARARSPRPMPRDAPVTSAMRPERSIIVVVVSRRRQPRDRRVQSGGVADADHGDAAVDLPDQPGEHRARTELHERASRLRATSRRTTSSQRTGADTWRIERLDRLAGACASARRPRWPRPESTGRAPSALADRGASRSSAGFISAQWNGALTASGIDPLRAAGAFASSPARATASAWPAITTCPGAFRFAGDTTRPGELACDAARHARATPVCVEPEDGGHRALADRHGLLHVLPAAAHRPQGIREG